MTFWIIVGQASRQTAFPIGPSTMARSKVLVGLVGTVVAAVGVAEDDD